MRRNTITLVVGVILLVIFFLLLFTFQVRQTEVALVTTFAKPSSEAITQPGLYFKWPLPIQRVYRFDKRVHSLEDEFDQLLTGDANNILASVFVGWSIARPREFLQSFPTGSPEAAEPQLKGAVRLAKQAVIGQHPFSDFVSSDPRQVKFAEIEKEMLEAVRQAALDRYGINVEFLGIRRLGLPESVTQKVFDRMTAERQREIDRLRAEGEKDAIAIRSAADRDRSQILARARAEATRIEGEADAKAAESFDVLKQNPDLAIFIMKMQGFEKSMNKQSILVVGPETPPFDVLSPTKASMTGDLPAAKPTTAPRELSQFEEAAKEAAGAAAQTTSDTKADE
jgi:membrane protease subunit HflC